MLSLGMGNAVQLSVTYCWFGSVAAARSIPDLILFSVLEPMLVSCIRAIPMVAGKKTNNEPPVNLLLFRVARDVERTVFRT